MTLRRIRKTARRDYRRSLSDDRKFICFATFSMILEGNALAPSFLAGDRLTVAPDIAPVPGDTVVIQVGGEYHCLKINADGDMWDSEGVHRLRGGFTFCGVVLDRTPAAG